MIEAFISAVASIFGALFKSWLGSRAADKAAKSSAELGVVTDVQAAALVRGKDAKNTADAVAALSDDELDSKLLGGQKPYDAD